MRTLLTAPLQKNKNKKALKIRQRLKIYKIKFVIDLGSEGEERQLLQTCGFLGTQTTQWWELPIVHFNQLSSLLFWVG